ncbi:MAG: arginine--tRNA ligase, partial [Gemmatimonadota bacterium]
MSAETLQGQLERIAADLVGDVDEAGAVDVRLERPRNPEHGDLATNLAMALAGRMGERPRDIAERIVESLDLAGAGMRSAEVAGPGFINFRFAHSLLENRLETILEADRAFGRAAGPSGRRIQVEFVSANPTGPLHVAHGRGAALGDAIARLLEAVGHEVEREFYVNDAGVQIDRLAASLEARWLQRRGEPVEVPADGYRGEYLVDLAREADDEAGDALASMETDRRIDWLRDWAVDRLRSDQDETLRAFGVDFDVYYPESRLYDEGRIDDTLADLADRGLTYESEGAVWLRTSDYGDDKDRVLVKSDGSYTYF